MALGEFTLSEKQKKELQQEIDKFARDGHYGAAYKYLYDSVPMDDYHTQMAAYSFENSGLRTWFYVAMSTNSRSGNVIDTSLRNITKEIMNQRGIGHEYSDEKYNQFSNKLAKKVLNDIAHTGKVSRKEILKADAAYFTRFDSNGKIKEGDWPGAIIDNILLGGDVVEASEDIDWQAIKEGLINALKDSYGRYSVNTADWSFPKILDISNVFGAWLKINRNGQYYQYDPLVLDLDGDGIETVATAGFSGSLFDHDSDGIINNGSELFGDNTQLANGQNTAHDYEALAELDSNADGKISADDVAFSLLKVWRDLNQDGKRFSCNNMIIFGF